MLSYTQNVEENGYSSEKMFLKKVAVPKLDVNVCIHDLSKAKCHLNI